MKVKAVRRVRLEHPVPVYDVTVPVTENFRLHQGPMVHNSKDCSDSLAGVVYGLYHRREIWGLHGVPMLKVYQSKSQVSADETSKETE